MKTLPVIIFALYFANFTFAQNTNWTISGKVSDENLKPVEFANVFVNNTSIGTMTDAKGFFLLTIPSQFSKIDLVISFVGFKSIKKKITATDPKLDLSFVLESNNMLKEIKVTAKSDIHWKRKWRKFEKALLGDFWFANECKILNPEVIHLEESENGKVLATASQPIIIQNDALGFKIIYEMEKFETDGKFTIFSGTQFFENFTSSNEQQKLKYKKNRKDAYMNSFMNFLNSLAQNSLEKNGFEVYKIKRLKEIYLNATLKNDLFDGSIIPCKASEICKFDEETEQYVLYSTYPLLVFLKNKYNTVLPIYSDYPFQYSSISLPNNYLVFAENGWLSKPNGMILHEYWSKEGFANLLPQNYTPDENEGLQAQKAEAVIAKDSFQTSLNTIEKKPIKQEIFTKGIETEIVVLDKNDLLKKAEKPIELLTADYTVKIKDEDYSYTIFDLLRKIPGMRVTYDPGTNEYTIGFNESHSQTFMHNGAQQSDSTPALSLDGVVFVGSLTVIPILNSISVRDIKYIGSIRFGGNAALGQRGSNGTIIITTK